MKPVMLETARLRLDSPSTADRARIVEYCSDPVFERFLTLPWPYRERDADVFLNRLVPDGWESDREYTWALRERLSASESQGSVSTSEPITSGHASEHPEPVASIEHPEPVAGPFLGVIGYRRTTSDIGYWLGAPHRGHGFMPEAMTAVVRWIFDLGVSEIAWECAAGNYASVSVARTLGFRYLGEKPANVLYRDGTYPRSWHGSLRADQLGVVQAGWPAETRGDVTRDDASLGETARDDAAVGSTARDDAAVGQTTLGNMSGR